MKKIIRSSMVALLAVTSMYAEGDIAPAMEPVSEDVNVVNNVMSSDIYNMGLTVGTMGVGINVATPIDESMQIRVNINGASYSRSESEEDVDYDADLNFANVGLLVDYFPSESFGFHLTAGAYYNANEISAEGRPTNGTFTIDDVDYQASQIGALNADLDFNKLAPYIGLGWGNDSRSEGFGFSLDIGALIGKPKLDLVATRGVVDDATWAQIQTSVANEKQTIDEDLNDMKIYPVIMLGMTYTF